MVFLFLSVSQMFMFFETDIKDLVLFCDLKGFDKIQKEDKISHRLCYGLLGQRLKNRLLSATILMKTYVEG